MTENYKIAMKLINNGFAKKHSTFDKTGRIVLNLVDSSERWLGYIKPNDKFVNVTLNNAYVGSASIDLKYMTVGYARIQHV